MKRSGSWQSTPSSSPTVSVTSFCGTSSPQASRGETDPRGWTPGDGSRKSCSKWIHGMPETFNIYCDESCHLEKDRQKVMVLGAVWSPSAQVTELARAARRIKQAFRLAPDFELKW